MTFPQRLTRQWLLTSVPRMSADEFTETCAELRKRGWTTSENGDIAWFLEALLQPQVRREVAARRKEPQEG